ncbi:MAG: allophanate hydrolase [Alphaproteobacteria bacterium]|nr:allophanate hydrolase [Alphaproteobacteria bacterium]
MTITSLHLSQLAAAYEAGTNTPIDVAREVLRRVNAAGDDHVWISKVGEAAVMARAALLAGLDAGARRRLPLYGIPFAVKDNIDVAGMTTTAACPAFAYKAERTASCVARLLEAGAILVGKTNLDQFATGLVGVRSPYGVPRNPVAPDYVPGGSSSGSAAAVSAGLVSFALGTDTAGSGRVPAGFTNIVGLKPTRGLISAAGVVPACRTRDCVSIFALTAHDALAVLRVAAAPDHADPYSRRADVGAAVRPPQFRFALPRPTQREFFGDAAARAEYEAGIERLVAMGGAPVEIDYAPFRAAAKLLYEGPWLAERLHATQDLLIRQPDALHPVTRKIIAGGNTYSGLDAYRGLYKLEELRAAAAPLWSTADILYVPTTGTIYTVAEIEADPIRLNANLGVYTNFVNFFDLSAIAVPSGFRPAGGPKSGTPIGATFIAPAFCEGLLAAFGAEFHARAGVSLGATGAPVPARPAAPEVPADAIDVAVVGAHLSGQPLNAQLTSIGAVLRRRARTAPAYRFYALPGPPPRPGLVRVAEGGAAIECEVWSVPAAKFGGFVAGIAAPLGIGKVALEDGTQTCGFICEPLGVTEAEDITRFGGWRKYLSR